MKLIVEYGILLVLFIEGLIVGRHMFILLVKVKNCKNYFYKVCYLGIVRRVSLMQELALN